MSDPAVFLGAPTDEIRPNLICAASSATRLPLSRSTQRVAGEAGNPHNTR
jgi:hypothetical protein